jgi:hypothetical protein
VSDRLFSALAWLLSFGISLGVWAALAWTSQLSFSREEAFLLVAISASSASFTLHKTEGHK